MSQIDLLGIGNTVSFETYAASILGNNYKNCVVTAHLDADSCRRLGSDVYAKHSNIYATLPAGTPDDADSYLFVKVKLVSGAFDYVGVPWIKPESISSAKLGKITVVLDGVGQSDVSIINTILAASNYKPTSITLE